MNSNIDPMRLERAKAEAKLFRELSLRMLDRGIQGLAPDPADADRVDECIQNLSTEARWLLDVVDAMWGLVDELNAFAFKPDPDYKPRGDGAMASMIADKMAALLPQRDTPYWFGSDTPLAPIDPDIAWEYRFDPASPTMLRRVAALASTGSTTGNGPSADLGTDTSRNGVDGIATQPSKNTYALTSTLPTPE